MKLKYTVCTELDTWSKIRALTDNEEDHEADDEERWAADEDVPGKVNEWREQHRRPEEEVKQGP